MPLKLKFRGRSAVRGLALRVLLGVSFRLREEAAFKMQALPISAVVLETGNWQGDETRRERIAVHITVHCGVCQLEQALVDTRN